MGFAGKIAASISNTEAARLAAQYARTLEKWPQIAASD
jgi:hypothetical protein